MDSECLRKILFKATSVLMFMSFASAAFAEDSGYVVGPQDVITVKVLKEEEFSGDYKIDSKGNINYSVVGDIPVSGKNLEEIKQAMVGILSKDYLVDPKVQVYIKEYNSKKVMVLGNVARPGVYPLTEKTMILDMITQAGGISSTGSSRVFVLRKEEPKAEIKQEELKDKDENLKTAPAKNTDVPVAEPVLDSMKGVDVQKEQIKKEGVKVQEKHDVAWDMQSKDVRAATGPVPLSEDAGIHMPDAKNEPEPENMLPDEASQKDDEQVLEKDITSIDSAESKTELDPTVVETAKEEAKKDILPDARSAKKDAGEIFLDGPPDKNAVEKPAAGTGFFSSPKKGAQLKPIIVNYEDILKKGDLSQNIEILGGDIINVPKANEVFVFGSVKNPGPVTYSENMGILQAVSLAGGTSPEASPGSTYVLRMDSGKEKKIKVNFNKVLKQKTKNLELQPNDVVVIPESFF